jgi:hypothetical protein
MEVATCQCPEYYSGAQESRGTYVAIYSRVLPYLASNG